MSFGLASAYIAVYVVFKEDDKYLLVQRGNTGWMDGRYVFPSGRAEEDEPALISAVREAEEEVGLKVKPENMKLVHTCYLRGDDGDHWLSLTFEAADWEGEAYNAEPHVHTEIKWASSQELPEMTPVNKFILEQIEAGETYGEFNWD